MPDIVDVTRSLMVIGLIFLLAFMLNHFIKRKEQRTMSARSAACLLFLLIELLALKYDVSFKNGIANLIAFAMSFLAYCTLLSGSKGIPKQWMRSTVGFIMFVPIGLALIFLPVTLFVGWMFFSDISDSGHDVVTLNRNYECRTFESSGILASTYSISLYQHWQFLPFVEHRAAIKWGDYANTKQISCDDVVTEYVQMYPEMASELKIENADAGH